MKTHDGLSAPQPNSARQADEDAYALRRDALDRAIKHLGGSGQAALVIDYANQFVSFLKGETPPAKAAS